MAGIVRSEPDLSASTEPFWTRLSHTIAWCIPRVDVNDPKGSLRTDFTRPRLFAKDYFGTVLEAVRSRYPRPERLPQRGSLEAGRLLVYFPDYDLCDGAAEGESHGFLDANNAPPWDTWVAMIDDERDAMRPYLIAWVPPEFVELADAGVRVNPEECVRWLDQAEIAMRRVLQNCTA